MSLNCFKCNILLLSGCLIITRNLFNSREILACIPSKISLTRRNSAIIQYNIGCNLTVTKFGHYTIRKYFNSTLKKRRIKGQFDIYRCEIMFLN